MRSYTLAEHGRLALGAGGLSHEDGRALVKAARRPRSQNAFRRAAGPSLAADDDEIDLLRLEPDSLLARQYVGLVRANDVSLEIFPKITHLSEASARSCLVRMLAVAFNIDVLVGAAAAHGRQDETLLDILIRLFASALVEQVRRGLPRGYVRQIEDRAALRGKLDVRRQFTTLISSPQRIACVFDELSSDITLNQVMAATVRFLRPLARRLETQRLLTELSFAYADVAPMHANTLPWDSLRFDRSNTRWRALVDLARLLMERHWQTVGRGDTPGTSLLFDMNRLFESYVARRLAPALPAGWAVSAPGERRWCVTTADKKVEALFQAQPDMVVRERGKPRLIIDTKWKQLAAPQADRKRGIAQGDLYQMMAYAGLYDVPILLLYPWHAACGGEAGERLAHYRIEGKSGGTISVGTVDVAQGDGSAPNDLAAQLWTVVQASLQSIGNGVARASSTVAPLAPSMVPP